MSVTLPIELEERLIRVAARRAMDPNRFALAALSQAVEEAEAFDSENSTTLDSALIEQGRRAVTQLHSGETSPLEESYTRGKTELERRIAEWKTKQ